MGVSSFDKINEALSKTSEFRDYVANVRGWLKDASPTKWTFSNNGTELPGTRIHFKCGPNEWSLPTAGWLTIANLELPMSDICSDADLNRIANNNFGKKGVCPTYFCKLEKVHEKWPKFARSEIRNRLMGEISALEADLREKARLMADSPECEQARTEYHERCIVGEITTVLLKYKNLLKPHILKTALDEYVAHEIMDC